MDGNIIKDTKKYLLSLYNKKKKQKGKKEKEKKFIRLAAARIQENVTNCLTNRMKKIIKSPGRTVSIP